jgi:tRNA U34 2-thiouridine synthase MnmA/TrmU
VPALLDEDRVLLAEQLSGVAAGQVAVLYDGNRVLGSGRITGTWS